MQLVRAAFGRGDWLQAERWRRLPELAPLVHQHGLAAFLFSRGPAQVPDAVLRSWRAEIATNLASFARQQRALQRVLQALQVAPAIPVIGWKGVDYAARLYADCALRPMGDHDLLVPEDRFADALSRLTALGYRAALKQAGVARAAQHYAAQLIADGHAIDLHRSVRQAVRAAVDYRAVFARAQPGEGCQWLDPRDRVLFHVAHMAGHELNVPLIAWVDLELLLQACPLDAELLGRAQQFHLARALDAALSLRSAVFGWGGLSASRLLPKATEVASRAQPPRALQLLRKAALFDAPADLLRFAGYAAGALLSRREAG